MALRLRRVHAGLTIPALVGRLHADGWKLVSSTVSRWEARRGSPSSRAPADNRIVDSLAKILGCSTLAFYRTPILTYDASEGDDDGEPD